MKKATILIIMAISFLLVATQALADDTLSNSNFFYGESIDNTAEVIRTADIQERTDVSALATDLSESVFFYGIAIVSQPELAGDISDEVKQLSGQRIEVMGTVMEEEGKQYIEVQDDITEENLPEIEY